MEQVVFRYDLDHQELALGQARIVEILKEQFGDKENIYAVWLEPGTPLSNVVRTFENRVFPEVPSLVSPEVEMQSKFLALVDTRNGADRIIQATRASGTAFETDRRKVREQDIISRETTGFIMVDELIKSGQGVHAQDFFNYYREKGVDITRCLTVETNFKVGERTRTGTGVRVSDLGYIAIFQVLMQHGVNYRTCAFMNVNKVSLWSFKSLDLPIEPFMGRSDLKSPTAGEKGFDETYRPVALQFTQKVVETFQKLTPFAAPAIVIH